MYRLRLFLSVLLYNTKIVTMKLCYNSLPVVNVKRVSGLFRLLLPFIEDFEESFKFSLNVMLERHWKHGEEKLRVCIYCLTIIKAVSSLAHDCRVPLCHSP